MIRYKFRYRLPDGVTRTDFQTDDLDCECEFYEISPEGRLLRWQKNGELKDTEYHGMLTLSASYGYDLYFELGTLAWIEVYTQVDRRWPFEAARFMPDQA